MTHTYGYDNLLFILRTAYYISARICIYTYIRDHIYIYIYRVILYAIYTYTYIHIYHIYIIAESKCRVYSMQHEHAANSTQHTAHPAETKFLEYYFSSPLGGPPLRGPDLTVDWC